MSSKTAFWFLFGMNISNTIHFMLFLRKKWKCADSIYTPCIVFLVFSISYSKRPSSNNPLIQLNVMLDLL
jgi:hypothetical protein